MHREGRETKPSIEETSAFAFAAMMLLVQVAAFRIWSCFVVSCCWNVVRHTS